MAHFHRNHDLSIASEVLPWYVGRTIALGRGDSDVVLEPVIARKYAPMGILQSKIITYRGALCLLF